MGRSPGWAAQSRAPLSRFQRRFATTWRYQSAVSAKPWSRENGGAHPNIARIRELSTCSDPVNRSTEPPCL